MTKRDIQKAYDQIYPTYEQRERMLDQILSAAPQQKSSHGRYEAPPAKTSRLSEFLALAACLAVLLLGSRILKGRTIQPDNPPLTDPVATASADSTSETLAPENAAFADVLVKYETALSENWTIEQCQIEDISELTVADRLGCTPGWTILDIDGDGSDELVISDGELILDIFILMEDGYPSHLVCSTETEFYNLYENGILGHQEVTQSGTWWYFYKFPDWSVQQVMYCEGGVYSAGANESSMERITKKEAGDILFSYSELELDLTHFVQGSELPELDEMDHYSPLIDRYVQAIQENWDPGNCAEQGISLMVGYYGDFVAELGYALQDLNADGIDELIITDGTDIYDLYTIIDDETLGPLRLLTATERERYFLTQDHWIYYMGSGSASEQYYALMGMDARSMEIVEGYMYDGNLDPDNPWFYYRGDGPGKSCPTAEAAAAIDGYEIEELVFMPFVSEQDISGTGMSALEIYQKVLIKQSADNPNIEKLFYALVDLDNDGVVELLYGTKDSFGHVYTIRNGDAVLLLSYGADEWFTLCENGIIQYHPNAENEYADYEFIRIKDGAPVRIDAIRYDNQKKIWYRESMNDTIFELGEEEMQRHIASYGTVELDRKPISDLLK